MTWATDRLDAIVAGPAEVPPVVATLKLGLLDAWGERWVRKHWSPDPAILGADGNMFGGYIAAMADQFLTFAAMTVAPDDCVFRTINLQLQFFKVAGPHPIDLQGRVVASTRRLISVEADFRRPDGDLLARATAQQILLPQER